MKPEIVQDHLLRYHIALLAVFPQVSVGAAFLNVSLRTYRQLHLSFGIMAVLQSLVHVVLAIQVTSFDLNVTLQRYGFCVSPQKPYNNDYVLIGRQLSLLGFHRY